MTNEHGTSAGAAERFSGLNLKHEKSGSGEPSIVFLSGHRTPLSNWSEVAPKASGMGTVLTYDRLDTGGSGPSSGPQHGDAILSTLDLLLQAAEVNPPYVLVAHSLGGLYANLYARRHPDRVGALVMVEAAHPGEAAGQAGRSDRKPGLLGNVLGTFTPAFRKDPDSEYNNVAATVRQIDDAPEFPATFLAVITGGVKMPLVPQASFENHLRWQEKLATLSPLGYQVMAGKSGHAPQVSEPDLILEAIAGAVESTKERFGR